MARKPQKLVLAPPNRSRMIFPGRNAATPLSNTIASFILYDTIGFMAQQPRITLLTKIMEPDIRHKGLRDIQRPPCVQVRQSPISCVGRESCEIVHEAVKLVPGMKHQIERPVFCGTWLRTRQSLIPETESPYWRLFKCIA